MGTVLLELHDRNGAKSETVCDVTDSLLPGNEDPQPEIHTGNGDTVEQTPQKRYSTGQQKDMRSVCSQHVFWKCNLWMAVTSAFVFMIFVIIISLVFYSTIYSDDDGFESLINRSSQYYTGTVKISDQCINSEEASGFGDAASFSANLNQRISDVFRTSPALGHYFRSAEIVSVSDNHNTATYNLHFTVPSDNSNFLKYTMSEEFVGGVLRQDVFDQEPTVCQPVMLDPSSITLSFLRHDEGMKR